jgi:hypothetical protein
MTAFRAPEHDLVEDGVAPVIGKPGGGFATRTFNRIARDVFVGCYYRYIFRDGCGDEQSVIGNEVSAGSLW